MWNSTWLRLTFLGSRLTASTAVLDVGCGWGLASAREAEALIDWPGSGPKIRGHLLFYGFKGDTPVEGMQSDQVVPAPAQRRRHPILLG